MPVKRINGQYVWSASDKQKDAIRFCEAWMKVKFTGSYSSYSDVCKYLDTYLKRAIDRARWIGANYRINSAKFD